MREGKLLAQVEPPRGIESRRKRTVRQKGEREGEGGIFEKERESLEEEERKNRFFIPYSGEGHADGDYICSIFV